jgi:hypothetical protein
MVLEEVEDLEGGGSVQLSKADELARRRREREAASA